MKALLIIDIQKDFMLGGSLQVPGAESIIPFINQLMTQFPLVLASKDWHPKEHMSFASTHHKQVGERVGSQILWPDHCIQNTPGSDFYEGLDQTNIKKIFYKGTHQNADSYSAFFNDKGNTSTGLKEFLYTHKVTELTLVGLVLEYCVAATALDAIKLGYSVSICKQGIATLLQPEEENKFLTSLKNNNINII
jgi:nicotinamidase/pyrazinamidase